MERWRGKVVIVTGVSSGCGAAIAKELVHHGMVVIGMARRVERVQQLAKELELAGESGKLHAIKTDLSKEQDLLAAFRQVEEKFGGADVLVNNSGVFNTSDVINGTVEEWKWIFDVNVIGTSICTREYLKTLKKNGKNEGHIINNNSVTGLVTGGTNGQFYQASKHALRAISGSLRKRLAEEKSKIKVTDICPGPVETEILEDTDMKGVFDKVPIMASRDVAVVVVDVLAASPVTQICEVVMNPIPTTVLVY